MADRAFDERGDYVAPKRRRYGLFAAFVVAALAFGYWVSPYVATVRFALAAQSGSSEAVVSRIDVAAVRNAFARQIVRTYMARNPQLRELDGLARQAVGGVAAGYVSSIISEYLTPETIAELLRQGRGSGRAGDLLGQNAPLPRLDDLRQGWALFMASGFSAPTSFAVQPGAGGPAEGYRLLFGFDGAGWPLRAVELPEAALSRLADELTMRIERKQ
jgi:hypothetical protein